MLKPSDLTAQETVEAVSELAESTSSPKASVMGSRMSSRFIECSMVTALPGLRGIASGEATVKSIRCGMPHGVGVYGVVLARLCGGVCTAQASLCGVWLKGYSGWVWRRSNASLSTSLLPSTVTCEGALFEIDFPFSVPHLGIW